MLDSARQLPPGQHAVELERFGLPQFARRHVDPPARPVLTVGGAVRRPTQLDVAELLARLPRREQRSDLHCVTTWSALDLAWSGAPFRDVAQLIVGVVQPDPRAHWLMAAGLDGFQSCLSLDDVLADDVLLADRLHGAALSPAHGAPLGWLCRRSTATRASSTWPRWSTGTPTQPVRPAFGNTPAVVSLRRSAAGFFPASSGAGYGPWRCQWRGGPTGVGERLPLRSGRQHLVVQQLPEHRRRGPTPGHPS